MPTIQVSKRELLRAVAQLNPAEYEEFVSDVLALRPEQTALAGLSEAELLSRIHRSLPDDVRRRFRELSAKVRNETISSAEHAELRNLIDQVENSDAKRVRALGELARRRGQSAGELMQQLGIQAPPHE